MHFSYSRCCGEANFHLYIYSFAADYPQSTLLNFTDKPRERTQRDDLPCNHKAFTTRDPVHQNCRNIGQIVPILFQNV